MKEKTSNPALGKDTFVGLARTGDSMTLGGTVNKTAMLLALSLITAMWVWGMYFTGDQAAIAPYMMVGVIGAFVAALVTIFFKTASPFTAPVYALLEGLGIGGISAMAEARYPGIAVQAVALTFGVLFSLLVAYKTGLIRATENFKRVIFAATGGIAVLYLVDLVLMAFGHPVGFIHQGGPAGILFSLFVVGIAAMNLVVDFDFIETGIDQGAPAYMEWYGAFSIMVTLFWLYLEILRLLGKARR